MNDTILLTRTGKQFFTYLKSDTKKIEAAKNAGFRVASKDEESAYLTKVGLELKPEPKPEPKAKTDQKPETPKATVEPTETQEPNN